MASSSSNRVVFPKTEPDAEDLAPVKLRAGTNLVPFKMINLYIPDDNVDESVPQVFALGRHMVETGAGNDVEVLSGYFSALCAFLPEGLDIAKRILENLSYRVNEVKIPSEASAWNISIPASSHLKLETINFALLCILPFHDNPKEVEAEIVRRVTTKFKFSFPSYCFSLCQEPVLENLRNDLFFSGLSTPLRRFIAASVRALATTSTPLGGVLSEVTDLCVE